MRYNRCIMAVSKTKQITTVIISTVIMLMLFGIFVLFYNSREETITYLVEQNECAWSQGVIIERLTEANFPIETTEVALSEEETYLANAEANNECTAKLGDSQGAYATEVNRAYANQE